MSDPLQRATAVLAQIAARNAALSIFIHVDADGALAAARASQARHTDGRPLSAIDGWLLAVKDNIDVAGMPTTAGLGFRRAQVATRDAFVVERLRAAGAVIIGKANMHAAAFGATNRNADFGDCANPAHPGMVPGGSSGGSAAAVAAGWADLALGTDTMGSVRIPASYCGVAGFKPSAGAISCAGVVPLCARLDHVGLLARDTGSILEALPIAAGFDESDSYSRPWHLGTSGLSLHKLRAPRGPVGTLVEPAVWKRFEAALESVAGSGWVIERFDAPACDFGAMRRAGLLLCEAEMLLTYEAAWRDSRSLFPTDMAAAMDWVAGKSARDVARSLKMLERATPLLRALLGAADTLLLPTAPQLPFTKIAAAPANQADLTVLANAAGAPALSLPLPCDRGAPSCGLQVLARPGHDSELLRLGVKIERMLAHG